MKEALTKVIDTLTQEDVNGAFQKLLERYNKWHCSRRRLVRSGLEFHVCTIKKMTIRKKYGNLLCVPCIYIYKQNLYKQNLSLNNLEGLICFKSLNSIKQNRILKTLLIETTLRNCFNAIITNSNSNIYFLSGVNRYFN